MQLLTHEEFMALEGPVLFTEHFVTETCGSLSYSNYSALMIRTDILKDTHFECVLIDSSVQQVYKDFDSPLDTYTIKGYTTPNKMYRVFSHDDIKIIMKNLQNVLDGEVL